VRTGVRVQNALGERTRYSASVERSYPDGRAAADLGLSHQTGYASVSAGLSVADSQALSDWSTLRGALVFDGAGVSFSPYRVEDTFGIVSTGGVPGVRITTPSGSVWTDRWGRAVLPSLPAYSRSQVQVVTKTLPRNADVDNGFKVVNPGRGSVQHVQFNVTTVRRVLLDVQMPDGAPIKRGTPVVGRKGNLIATAIDDRRVFLPNATPDEPLRLQLADGRYCELSYALPDQSVSDRAYERAKARCIPVTQAP
jgi:outer membrane usher protein FimD/PapC